MDSPVLVRPAGNGPEGETGTTVRYQKTGGFLKPEGALIPPPKDAVQHRMGVEVHLTPDREFACRWAYKGYMVNEYELDLTGLNVIRFSRERAWFAYIFKNRRSEDTLTADIVTGPVANDTLYDTLGIISSGFLKPEDALALLQIGPVFTQTAVKSMKALQQLRWTGAQKVIDDSYYRDLVRKEESEYQEQFAAYMQQLSDPKA